MTVSWNLIKKHEVLNSAAPRSKQGQDCAPDSRSGVKMFQIKTSGSSETHVLKQ